MEHAWPTTPRAGDELRFRRSGTQSKTIKEQNGSTRPEQNLVFLLPERLYQENASESGGRNHSQDV